MRGDISGDGGVGDLGSDFYTLVLFVDDGWRLRRYIDGTVDSTLDSDLNYIANNNIDGNTVIDIKLEAENIDGSTVRLTGSIALDGGAYQVVTTTDDTSANRLDAAGEAGFFIRGDDTRIAELNAEDFVSDSCYICVLKQRQADPFQ